MVSSPHAMRSTTPKAVRKPSLTLDVSCVEVISHPGPRQRRMCGEEHERRRRPQLPMQNIASDGDLIRSCHVGPPRLLHGRGAAASPDTVETEITERGAAALLQ